MDRVESVEMNGIRYAEGDDEVVRLYKGRDEEVWNKTVKEKKYDKQKDDVKKRSHIRRIAGSKGCTIASGGGR